MPSWSQAKEFDRKLCVIPDSNLSFGNENDPIWIKWALKYFKQVLQNLQLTPRCSKWASQCPISASWCLKLTSIHPNCTKYLMPLVSFPMLQVSLLIITGVHKKSVLRQFSALSRLPTMDIFCNKNYRQNIGWVKKRFSIKGKKKCT